jgi:hypothetical protein
VRATIYAVDRLPDRWAKVFFKAYLDALESLDEKERSSRSVR